MTKNVLITGSSSGLGRELAEKFDSMGYNVYCISRSETKDFDHSVQCDFRDLPSIVPKLRELIGDVKEFEYVFLNAGMLGNLNPIKDITTDEYINVFNVNVLSNKIALDILLKETSVKNVIGISSGAALKTYFGWSLYCTSKAAFKQLISSYADEYKDTFFVSLAPGVMDTKMQNSIQTEDESRIPSVKKFKELSKSNKLEHPSLVAHKIFESIKKIQSIESGSYIDLRDIYKEKTKEQYTILCDIDGCLIRHQDSYSVVNAQRISKTFDKLKEWDRSGHKLILTTGRRESARKVTEETLEHLGITYDQLIMGLGPNKRVLINDLKPNSKEPTAIAINLDRNWGIFEIDL